jgi:hypothetical protein
MFNHFEASHLWELLARMGLFNPFSTKDFAKLTATQGEIRQSVREEMLQLGPV